MKTFRGKNVLGWKVVVERTSALFEKKINKLMDEYNFEDFQFSMNNRMYVAVILISIKDNTPEIEGNINDSE
jgi:hypothetical protein